MPPFYMSRQLSCRDMRKIVIDSVNIFHVIARNFSQDLDYKLFVKWAPNPQTQHVCCAYAGNLAEICHSAPLSPMNQKACV